MRQRTMGGHAVIKVVRGDWCDSESFIIFHQSVFG